jgi:hypothetical protein
MKTNEMTLSEALSHVRSMRSIVNPNPAFITELEQYEAKLETERKMERARNENIYGNGSAMFAVPDAIGPSLPFTSVNQKTHSETLSDSINSAGI